MTNSVHRRRQPIVKRSPAAKLAVGFRQIMWLCLGVGVAIFSLYFCLYRGGLWAFSRSKVPVKIVIVSPKLLDQNNFFYYVLLDRANQQLTFVDINPHLKMKVLGGYGQYELRAVAPLLEMEKKPTNFVRSSLALGLGQGLDQAVLMADSVGQVDRPDQISHIFRQLLMIHRWNDLDIWWQTWQWWCFVSSLTPNQFSVIKINSPEEWQNYQARANLSLEPACSVAVVNTTSTPKLAANVGATLEHAGVRVVRNTNELSEVPSDSQILVAPGTNCEQSLEQLKNILPQSTKIVIDEKAQTQYRADSVLIIGQDLETLDEKPTLQ